jgi:hypothetical protein
MLQLHMKNKKLLGLVVLSLAIMQCNEDSTGPNLPSGCSAQGVFAIAALETALTCLPTNAYANPEEALGAPNHSSGEGKLEIVGILSLGVAGHGTFYMGSCIQDAAGPDLRVHQVGASEAVEVQVSADQDGPFTSLGFLSCKDFCDFDLAGSGLDNVRVVRVIDSTRSFDAGAECDNTGPSPGADIDSIEVLHPGS